MAEHIKESPSEIKQATDDLIHSFEGVCNGLLRPMSEQFTRYRLKEIEDKVKDLEKELVKMHGKILNLSGSDKK